MRLVQANLITKKDFDAELSSLNTKIPANKSKHLLVEEDGTQNYLLFQPINMYFKVIANTDYVSS